MNGIREAARLADVRRGRLHPEQIGVGRVRNRARGRRIDAAFDHEEAFRRALAGEEWMIAFVDVAGQQRGAVRIRPCDDERRHAHDVRRQTRSGERADELRGRHENFSAEVAAFFLGGELIFEMDRRRAALDHLFHQLECVQTSAEARLGIGHDRREPVRVAFSFAVIDLIGAL